MRMFFVIALFIMLLAGGYMALKFAHLAVWRVTALPRYAIWIISISVTIGLLAMFQKTSIFCLYFILLCAIFDLAGLFIHDAALRKWIFNGFVPIVISLLICGYGFIHAKNIVEKNYKVTIEGMPAVRIVLITDMHTGTAIKIPELKKLPDMVNAMNADLVLLGGDIYDGSNTQDEMDYTFTVFNRLKARYGVYYVTGNHEYINYKAAERQEIFKRLTDAGVTVLEDKAVLIDSKFYLVGRNDRSDRNRLSIAGITAPLDKNLPVILLDHQPVDFENTQAAGVDLQLSGHTHNGQVFPAGLISRIFKINALQYGYKKFGSFQAIVSAGAGAWGNPVRVGTNSEIVVVDITY